MTVTGPTAYNGQSVNMNVVPTVPVKDPAKYTIVGTSVPRVDIPAKVIGSYVYTQHITVPGMLHARMVLPPDVGAYPRMVPQLLSARFKSKPPAGVQLVVKGNFVAVVAEDEWKAIQARTLVDAKWAEDPRVRNLGNYYGSLPHLAEQRVQSRRLGDHAGERRRRVRVERQDRLGTVRLPAADPWADRAQRRGSVVQQGQWVVADLGGLAEPGADTRRRRGDVGDLA